MRSLPLLLALTLMPALASASAMSYTGQFDPNQPNNVLLTSFTLSSASEFIAQSYGYGGSGAAPDGTNAAGTVITAGGFDSYFSLFAGTGDAATFLASNDDGGCGPAAPDPVCEDARLSLTDLPAGSYVLALTLPGNYSLAENYGSGDLGDGFLGLQADFYDDASGTVRSANYAFDLTTTPVGGGAMPPAATTPEPASLLLLGTGLGAVAMWQRRWLPRAEGD